eukprot:761957-Hanusia_phi.AAC.4
MKLYLRAQLRDISYARFGGEEGLMVRSVKEWCAGGRSEPVRPEGRKKVGGGRTHSMSERGKQKRPSQCYERCA